MYGLLSQNSSMSLMSENTDISSGGGSSNAVSSTPTSSQPLTNFDIGAIAGLRPSDKYLGKNRVSDIQEAYQTYITGNPVGRGGQYAVDAARKYGVSVVEAARGYLQGVGLPIIPQAATTTVTDTTTNQTVNTPQNPFQVLADILPKLFGNAVYNPPLQTQAYGYTPTETSQPLQTSGGGLNLGLIIILGVIGVIVYFVYKRFAN